MSEVIVIKDDEEETAAPETPEAAGESLEGDTALLAVAAASAAVSLANEQAAATEMQAAQIISESERSWQENQMKLEALEASQTQTRESLQVMMSNMSQMAESLAKVTESLNLANSQAMDQSKQNEDAADLANLDLVTVEVQNDPAPQPAAAGKKRKWI